MFPKRKPPKPLILVAGPDGLGSFTLVSLENVKYITEVEVHNHSSCLNHYSVFFFILQSWHVYNDKNREKVRKDEKTARIEKEKIEERARVADREHRLNILRSRANIEMEESPRPQTTENCKEKERFELFPNAKEKSQDRNISKSLNSSKAPLVIPKTEDDVLAGHMKNDPMFHKTNLIKKSKGKSSKDYSFV